MRVYELDPPQGGDVRCLCRNCGCHLKGTVTAMGVTGACSNCGSFDVEAIPGTLRMRPLRDPVILPRVR